MVLIMLIVLCLIMMEVSARRGITCKKATYQNPNSKPLIMYPLYRRRAKLPRAEEKL